MSDLCKNAVKFLQNRFPRATVIHNEATLTEPITGEIVHTIWPMIAQDPDSGIKQRAIAIPNLGQKGEIVDIAYSTNNLFTKLDAELMVSFDNLIQPKGHKINSTQMSLASKIILYTNKLHISYEAVIHNFSMANLLVEIISEGEMYNSLFISYGGPDEYVAAKINAYLKNQGIKTWFFPDDALPGQKLHRVMYEGVNDHDRVLLLCSQQSLSRSGVLNELERVLEREAKEGGSEILIPIALDKFVYSDWAPNRPDLAKQIRSRVIIKIEGTQIETEDSQKQLSKLVTVLSKAKG